MSENIKETFVKDAKFVYLGEYTISHRMYKNHIYTVKENIPSVYYNIIFVDEKGYQYSINPFDCGYFMSLKDLRKKKLKKLNHTIS